MQFSTRGRWLVSYPSKCLTTCVYRKPDLRLSIDGFPAGEDRVSGSRTKREQIDGMGIGIDRFLRKRNIGASTHPRWSMSQNGTCV
jgi:hypothetical protein